MKDGAKKIAFTAVLCALSVLLLYLASVLPTMRLALIAAAGILPAAAVIRFGLSSGFALYAAASILALLLLPSKSAGLLYLAVFGHYPMLKSLIERLRKRWLEWVLKLALFNGLLTVLLLFFSVFVADFFTLDLPVSGALAALILYAGGNLAFVVYDIGFSGLIAVFQKRILTMK